MAGLLKRRGGSYMHVYSVAPHIATWQICSDSDLTQLFWGWEERVSSELSSSLHVFTITETNGKEVFISSDMEDRRFIAQIRLG